MTTHGQDKSSLLTSKSSLLTSLAVIWDVDLELPEKEMQQEIFERMGARQPSERSSLELATLLVENHLGARKVSDAPKSSRDLKRQIGDQMLAAALRENLQRQSMLASLVEQDQSCEPASRSSFFRCRSRYLLVLGVSAAGLLVLACSVLRSRRALRRVPQ